MKLFHHKIKPFLRDNRHHFNNIFWSNLNLAITTLVALALSIVFIRMGSKELYGQYLFILSTFGLFSVMAVPGVRTVIFRAVSQGREGVYSKATNFSFMWSLLGIPLLLLAGLYFYFFKAKILGISLMSSAIFLPFIASLQNWIPFLKGRSFFKKLVAYCTIQSFVTFLAVISVILTKNIIIIIIIYLSVRSIFNIIYHFKSLKLLANKKDDDGWKKQSFALSIIDFSSLMFGQLDIILIGILLPIGQVAIYGLVMSFIGIFIKGIKSTLEAILPKLYSDDSFVIKSFYKYFLASFFIPLILYPLIKYPIILVYGNEYTEVIRLSKIYLFVIPFYFLFSISHYFLVKYKLNKQININKITSIIVVIALYVILIPIYGIIGGVIASMAYFLVQVILNIRSLNKYHCAFS